MDRMISGAEALAVQGFCHFLQAQCKPGFSFTNTQKMDLAGNAFNAAVVILVFTAMVACAPLGQAISFAAPAADTEAGEMETSDSDVDGEEFEGNEAGESDAAVSSSVLGDDEPMPMWPG